MRMLRWMCEITKLDKVRNERIRGTTKVGEIAMKVQERMLKWYAHVMRREEHYVGRRVMEMKVQGRWRDSRLMKCRPSTTVLHGGVCHRTSTPHKSGNR